MPLKYYPIAILSHRCHWKSWNGASQEWTRVSWRSWTPWDVLHFTLLQGELLSFFVLLFFFTAISIVKCFQFQVQQSRTCGVFAWTWDGGWCSGGGRHDCSSLCFQVGLLISIVVVLYVWWFSHSRYARTEYIRVDLGGGCSASVKNSTQVHIQKQRCDLICDF